MKVISHHPKKILAFGEILSWTLMWSFFATFTNYFLGMFVAILINKKGIYFKLYTLQYQALKNAGVGE